MLVVNAQADWTVGQPIWYSIHCTPLPPHAYSKFVIRGIDGLLSPTSYWKCWLNGCQDDPLALPHSEPLTSQ